MGLDYSLLGGTLRADLWEKLHNVYKLLFLI